jgi:hypothetical protein
MQPTSVSIPIHEWTAVGFYISLVIGDLLVNVMVTKNFVDWFEVSKATYKRQNDIPFLSTPGTL